MTYFGGPCVDPRTADWSKFHEIKDDGNVKNRNWSDLNAITNHGRLEDNQTKTKEEALRVAGQLGLAAGKLYVEWIAPTSTGSETEKNQRPGKCFSGFWIQGGYFLTCAHWFDGYDYTATQVSEILQQLIDQRSSACWVSSDSHSTCTDTDEDIMVFLWRQDFDGDIAIFRPHNIDQEPDHCRHYGVSSEQLVSYLPNIINNVELPVWTVAYVAENFSMTSPTGEDFKRRRPKDESEKVGKVGTVHEYLMAFYLQDLSQSNSGAKLRSRLIIQGKSQDTFISIFKANHRALAAGQIPNENNRVYGEMSKAYAMQQVDIHSTKKPLRKNVMHTISGFFGASGAMIATWADDDQKFSPIIIGLFIEEVRGKPANSFAAFTEDGIAWIKESMNMSMAEHLQSE